MWITYCTLLVKLPNPTLSNIKRLGQSEKAEMKSTTNSSLFYFDIVCQYYKIQGFKIKDGLV